MHNPIRRLPDSELEVMQAIWARTPPVTRSDIEKRLADSYPIAQTTLLTLLARLTEKGFLSAEKAGQKKIFVPLITQQEYLAAQGNRFFRKLCGGSLSTFAAALCDSGLTREEIAELRALLERDAL